MRQIGREYEEVAAQFLRRQGFKIVEHSYRCRLGEVDIVAYEGEALVFVEVKARSNPDFGGPFCAVAEAQKKRIVKAAIAYIKAKNVKPESIRFDVVGIVPGEEPELVRNAFSSDRYFM
ncbi:MAG: YraN family protein [Elusimicrobia bacterium]|nr:YraN family protein [Elusimicrobiota bacterium]